MKYLSILIIVLLLVSCETELTDFTVKTSENTIVVSGEINTLTGPYIIRLNKTTNYDPYEAAAFVGRAVTKASVIIEDNLQNQIVLTEIAAGVYQTPIGFKVVEGGTYQLKIKTADNLLIESKKEKVLNVAKVLDYKSTYIKNQPIQNSKFNLDFKLSDDPATENYYFIKRQDFKEFLITCVPPPPPPGVPPPCFSKCWQAPLNTTPTLVNDFLINGKTIPINLAPCPLDDITEYVVDIRVYNVSKDYYTYWKRLEEQRTVNGDIFDKIPSQIIGNMVCTNDNRLQVLGTFSALACVKKRLRINRYSVLNDTDIDQLTNYVVFNKIRFPDYQINKCWEASFVPYNIGNVLPD